MYFDAFATASQCQKLEPIQQDKIWEDSSTETLVYICYNNWIKSGKSFVQPHDCIEKYNFKSIQKDSMRCYLLYIPVQIRAFICQIQQDNFDAGQITNFLIQKLKLLKFGIRMLEVNDLHVRQIKLFLEDTVSKIQPLLDKCNII